MENNMRIIEQKKLLDLAMDFYFLNGIISDSNVKNAEIAVRSGYDFYFGENASKGLSEQDLIRNALGCYENISTLIESAGKQSAVAEFTVDELIVQQKRVLNIAKELSFISGAKKGDYQFIQMSEEHLRRDFDSIFGKDASVGKSYSRMAGEILSLLESKNYPKLTGLAVSEKTEG